MKANISYQKLEFPQKYVNVTQGSYGNFSHSKKPAIDSAGGNSQANNVYSPGSGKITYIENKHKSHCYIEFKNVVSPLGKMKDVLYAYMYHNIPFSKFFVGYLLSPREYFMNEGQYYEPGGGSFGNHLHAELLNTSRRTNPRNSVKPEDWYFLVRGYHVFIKNNSKDHFYWMADKENKQIKQLRINRAKVQIRKSKTTQSTLLGFAELGYWTIQDTVTNSEGTWYKVYKDMWIKHTSGCEVIKTVETPKEEELPTEGIVKEKVIYTCKSGEEIVIREK